MAESEPKGRSGPLLARARFAPLRPFGSFLHLESYKAESSNDRIEANSGKINFGPLCNIRPFDFRSNGIFRPFDTLGLLKIRLRFFGQSSRSLFCCSIDQDWLYTQNCIKNPGQTT
jgi:hypothetical protein